MNDPRDDILATIEGASPVQDTIDKTVDAIREHFMNRARELAETRSINRAEQEFFVMGCEIIWEEIERETR